MSFTLFFSASSLKSRRIFSILVFYITFSLLTPTPFCQGETPEKDARKTIDPAQYQLLHTTFLSLALAVSNTFKKEVEEKKEFLLKLISNLTSLFKTNAAWEEEQQRAVRIFENAQKKLTYLQAELESVKTATMNENGTVRLEAIPPFKQKLRTFAQDLNQFSEGIFPDLDQILSDYKSRWYALFAYHLKQNQKTFSKK